MSYLLHVFWIQTGTATAAAETGAMRKHGEDLRLGGREEQEEEYRIKEKIHILRYWHHRHGYSRLSRHRACVCERWSALLARLAASIHIRYREGQQGISPVIWILFPCYSSSSTYTISINRNMAFTSWLWSPLYSNNLCKKQWLYLLDITTLCLHYRENITTAIHCASTV